MFLIPASNFAARYSDEFMCRAASIQFDDGLTKLIIADFREDLDPEVVVNTTDCDTAYFHRLVSVLLGIC